MAEADEARSALVQQGLGDLNALTLEVERARFFALADLFIQCRDRAKEVQLAYAGSEVADAAASLVKALDAEGKSLTAGQDESELQRLKAIQSTLAQSSASGLAAELAAYIEKQENEDDREESDQGR